MGRPKSVNTREPAVPIDVVQTAAKPKRQRRIGTLHSSPQMRRARIAQSVELQLHGLTQPVVAKMMGVSTESVHKWNKIATDQGIIEEVRARLTHSILAKAADAYEHILGADVDLLTKNHRGYGIKLKAAKDIAEGVGALRKEALAATRRGTVTLDAYYERREIAAGAAEVTRERVSIQHPVGVHALGEGEHPAGRLGERDLSDRGELPILDGEVTGGSDPHGTAGAGEADDRAPGDHAAEVDGGGSGTDGGAGRGAEGVTNDHEDDGA